MSVRGWAIPVRSVGRSLAGLRVGAGAQATNVTRESRAMVGSLTITSRGRAVLAASVCRTRIRAAALWRYDAAIFERGTTLDRLKINSFGRLTPHEVATAQGFYAAEELEVEHAATTASKVQMQELKDGVWDVVHTHPDNVFWWNEDNAADLLIVLALPAEPNLIFV